jgi:AbrB family transcriptional regulator, stage V sporulation protein T
MKATGIVRRIDELGRVVIPKEIRRTLQIREGNPLEIYTNRDGEVIFKKYSPIGELNGFASQYAETLHKTCDLSVVICDRDCVIACAGVPKKDFIEKHLSKDLAAVIEARSLYTMKTGDRRLYITDDTGTEYFAYCIMPIITEGDINGCVAAVIANTADTKIVVSDTDQKLIQTAALFLGKQLEQ